jgi:hypothetical protein
VFGIGLINASASIVYTSITQNIATSSVLFSAFTPPSAVIGASDAVYATGTILTSTAYWVGANANFGLSGIPSNATIDSIQYIMSASSSVSFTIGGGSLFRFGAGSVVFSPWGTVAGTGYQQMTVLASSTVGGWQYITPANIDNLSLTSCGTMPCGVSIVQSTGSSKAFSIDSVSRIIYYHFDNAVLLSRINSQSISSLNTSSYPSIVSSTSTLTTTYYYNSNDDNATSTKYTQLQYSLHDNFTNTDQYFAGMPGVAWTKNTTYATSSISNFCNGGAFNCYNGDTYTLYTRFSNDDNSVVSAWFSPTTYFSYGTTGTYNPPTNTYIKSYLYSTSTGNTSLDFIIATSDSPVLLSLNERNDRDGQLPNQPKYYPFPSGESTTTATPVIPSDPNNSGATYLTASLVSASNYTQVFDSKLITIFMGSTSASTTIAGTAIIAYQPQPCGLTQFQGCVQNAICALFCPSQASLNVYSAFVSIIQTKPPVGYFYIVKNKLNNLATSSTPVFTVSIPVHFKQYFFNPFDTAIAGILWFFFAVHFYKRLKTITV